eukprot:Filipodium_phascolosomae@DN2705_c0_g2_i2.p1
MNPIRTKVVAVLLMCMIANHALVEGQDNFLDRPNVDSVDSAGLRRLVTTISSASITNAVKAGVTTGAFVELKMTITQDVPALGTTLLVTAPTGFEFASGDCKQASALAGCTKSGAQAKWTFTTAPTINVAFTLSTKLSSVPSWAAPDAKFVVTYSGATQDFPVSGFLKSVKGGSVAAAVGGDASFAIMRPVNHT